MEIIESRLLFCVLENWKIIAKIDTISARFGDGVIFKVALNWLRKEQWHMRMQKN